LVSWFRVHRVGSVVCVGVLVGSLKEGALLEFDVGADEGDELGGRDPTPAALA
jgi:hypothetical protein